MAFRFQAINSAGAAVVDLIDAASYEDATQLLRDRGLFVTGLETVDATTARPGASRRAKVGGKFRDVLLFTQQMSMLLRSGAQVIEALDAIVEQTQRAGWLNVVQSIRADVQEGRPLSAAVEKFPGLFPGVYVSMITAGEASGELGVAFDRLAVLTRQQLEVRNRVVGAIAYPAVLLGLCGAVMGIMMGFILPRFAEMFEALDVELPLTTQWMIATSNWVQAHWVVVLIALAAGVIGLVMISRQAAVRERLSRLVLRTPVIGGLICKILLARMCRIWGQLMQSKVALLDVMDLIHQGTRNAEFRDWIARLRRAITDGNKIGPVLKESRLIPRVFAGAIATGEESGRLADSLLFVSGCLDDENNQALASLTRILEPIILAVMGVIVGTMAFSLFLPMFDMASMGH